MGFELTAHHQLNRDPQASDHQPAAHQDGLSTLELLWSNGPADMSAVLDLISAQVNGSGRTLDENEIRDARKGGSWAPDSSTKQSASYKSQVGGAAYGSQNPSYLDIGGSYAVTNSGANHDWQELEQLVQQAVDENNKDVAPDFPATPEKKSKSKKRRVKAIETKPKIEKMAAGPKKGVKLDKLQKSIKGKTRIRQGQLQWCQNGSNAWCKNCFIGFGGCSG